MMPLPRHTLSSHVSAPLFTWASCTPLRGDVSDEAASRPDTRLQVHEVVGARDSRSASNLYVCATDDGFIILRAAPLKIVARRNFPPSQGGLSFACAVDSSSLLVLVGGGRVPLFAPNKVVLWDEAASLSIAAASSSKTAGLPDEDQASTVFDAGSAQAPGPIYRKQSSRQVPAISGSPTVSASSRSLDLEGMEARRRVAAWARESGHPDLHLSSAASEAHEDDASSIASSSRDSKGMQRSGALSSLLHGNLPAHEPVGDVEDEAEEDDGLILRESSQELATDPTDLELRGMSASQLHQLSNEASTKFSDSSAALGKLSSDSESFRMDSSQHGNSQGRSISASSAGLDDPFASHSGEDARSSSSRSASSDGGASYSGEQSTKEDVNKASHQAKRDQRGATSRTSEMGSAAGLARHLDDLSLEQAASGAQMDRSLNTSITGSELPAAAQERRTAAMRAGAIPIPERTTVSDADRGIAEGKGREVAELEFGEAVQGVRVKSFRQGTDQRSTMLVALLETQAHVFELADQPNEKSDAVSGVMSRPMSVRQVAKLDIAAKVSSSSIAISSHAGGSALVALPGRQRGHVQLLRLPLSRHQRGMERRAILTGATSILAAHSSSVTSLALSQDGSLLATASARGTLIRVWAVTKSAPHNDGGRAKTQIAPSLLREFRRGTDQAGILDVSFAPDNCAVAVASDTGTIHIFSMLEARNASTLDNVQNTSRKTTTAFRLSQNATKYLPSAIGGLVGNIPKEMLPKYFKSEWSDAQFFIPLEVFSSRGKGLLVGPRKTRDVGGSHARQSARDENHRSDTVAAQKDSSRVEAVGGGEQRSTEGAWAAMRARVGDVLKGEASIEERIFLSWIRADAPMTSTSQDAETGRVKKRAQDEGPSLAPKSRDGKYHLVALTSSGGYYRIALAARPDTSRDVMQSSKETSSVVLDMYKESEEGASTSVDPKKEKRGKSFGCELVEFSRFGSEMDEW
ncbi:hypothetical protein IE81DRAFT_340484 [Ceraceosorus guamensis]|uniref:WD40 repeat-like protein n=1 Tax=Ceraceosorus guamensis TaxID=1522189 RepID=A0A316W3Z7_9BASI|nr:hypothetical protein IE81DRAFT_340484 [Ceraceosorus guamensis]PWN43828.1 hypothetical protein IE81DRAFT_340484 [Ceraceosorus guamensis]